MTETEKQQLLDKFQENQEAMLEVINRFTENDFLQKTDGERWSAAEVVEHVINVESGVVGNLRKMGAKASEVNFKDPPSQGDVIARSANRATKVPAPDIFIPKGRFNTKAMAITTFSQHREEVANFVNTVDFDLKAVAFPHPRLGMFNGENWLAFIIGHCQRHIEQIHLIQQDIS